MTVYTNDCKIMVKMSLSPVGHSSRSKVPKILLSHLSKHSPAAPSQPLPPADQDLSRMLSGQLAQGHTSCKEMCFQLSIVKLSIVLLGNLSHGLSNKCISCNECFNVYRMSYMIVVHTTMKRQMTTKKGRALLNADDLIKYSNLINELTSSRVFKNSYTYAYTHVHIIYKTESYPYNILCCTQSM